MRLWQQLKSGGKSRRVELLRRIMCATTCDRANCAPIEAYRTPPPQVSSIATRKYPPCKHLRAIGREGKITPPPGLPPTSPRGWRERSAALRAGLTKGRPSRSAEDAPLRKGCDGGRRVCLAKTRLACIFNNFARHSPTHYFPDQNSHLE